jgi:ATP synthase subunit 6
MILGPLEQFENFTLLAFRPVCSFLARTFSPLASYCNFHVMWTTFSVSGLVLFIFFIGFNIIIHLQPKLVPSSAELLFDRYFLLIGQIIRDLVVHSKGKSIYFGLLTFLFVFLNVLNVSGLVPYSFAFTSYFVLTFSLSTIFFCALNATGLLYHGVALLGLFFPGGTPLFIAPLITSIELISYFARMFSLAIRLFANITAGHILLKILSWFTYLLTDVFFIGVLGALLITSLWGLEFFISILQAYVFLILLCIYLQDVLQLH